MLTDHLILNLNDRKIKVRGNMKIVIDRGYITLINHVATVVMSRLEGGVFATVNGEGPFLVEKYHVSYTTYPQVRKALS